MAKRKIIIRTRRVSYRGLDGNFTQIANKPALQQVKVPIILGIEKKYK